MYPPFNSASPAEGVADLVLVRAKARMTKFTLMALGAVLTVQFAVAADTEISRDRAHQLATWYFARYFPREGCGGAAEPVRRGDRWESTVRIGYAGTPSGTIFVHRYTGRVSYHGPFFLKPPVSADSLVRWASRENITRKP